MANLVFKVYSDSDQYGMGREDYDDLKNCVLTLLQVQPDHERQLANTSSAATAAELSEGNTTAHPLSS